MQPLNLDGIKAILYPCSFAGQENDFFDEIGDNVCFGVTRKGNRCRRPLRNSRRRELTHSLNELVRLASAYEDYDDDDEAPKSIAEAFFITLGNFINLQHCYQHNHRPKMVVAEWQMRLNDAYHKLEQFRKQSREQDEEQDKDTEDDNDSNVSTVSSPNNSLLCDTPRHSRTITPSTTPQTGRAIHFTIPAKSTHSTHSDTSLAPEVLADDGPSPPATPTRGARPRKQKKQQNQQQSRQARLSIRDERRQPQVDFGASADSDVIAADNSETLQVNDDDIVATPQPLGTVIPRVSSDTCASSKDSGAQKYEDYYMGTDYLHIIKTMQSGYTRRSRSKGRLYVLRKPSKSKPGESEPGKSNIFKIGFSAQMEIKNRWNSTPCSQVAVSGDGKPEFVSQWFRGAFKAEALVKASLRHRIVGYCDDCHLFHTEWFRVDKATILAWVHAWTAYVQSDIYDAAGNHTGAYHGFANRLLRITPARIHTQLAAMPSREPHPGPEVTVANLATTNVQGGDHGGGGGILTEEPPPQPKPAPMVAAPTSMQRLLRRAKTWDSGNSSSLIKWRDKNGNGCAVAIQETEEREDPDGRDDRRHNLRQIKKASKVASQVTSKIQLGISGMVKRGARLSKRT
ncbi:hypothetical protein F503_01359 [Ophiostoma piceae UAMH 11346]|uniref:Bacteriophage T5 Orf172 DNA-binding domain-containing protein n=1 Tax=Ophiostoma piceae (strain UAMH 11346) TaxID=1262450 RepID=S3CUG9_OPHP1|nr:hypothetical protein F503_01359 [Ophiostoma piceae UAMH 11346]